MTMPPDVSRADWESVFIAHGWDVNPRHGWGRALKRGVDVAIPEPTKPWPYYAAEADVAMRYLLEDYPEYAALMASLLGELGCES